MFSSAHLVNFLFVCLLVGLRKNYLTDFHRNRWKGGRWKPRMNPLDFRISLRYVYGLSRAVVRV